MANTIGWGKATQNNTNGYGKYQNTIGAASVYAVSAAGETVIEGTSAAFTYAKSSYHQDESDPTPTITGTAGGTFSGTSGIVFVDSGTNSGSSTGQVDLSASTIQANTITYTVSGVSANFSLSVTASPFLANTYSMQFDSASSQYVEIPNSSDLQLVNTDFSISFWLNPTNSHNGMVMQNYQGGVGGWGIYYQSGNLRFISMTGPTVWQTLTTVSTSQWTHILIVGDDTGNNLLCYKNGAEVYNASYALNITSTPNNTFIGSENGTGLFFNGKIDEVGIWNTTLSADAVTEIYNATNNNSGKALDLLTDSGNYNASSNLQYFNRMGD